jgi:hypothetical protein
MQELVILFGTTMDEICFNGYNNIWVPQISPDPSLCMEWISIFNAQYNNGWQIGNLCFSISTKTFGFWNLHFRRKLSEDFFFFQVPYIKLQRKIGHHTPTFFFQVKKVCIVLKWKGETKSEFQQRWLLWQNNLFVNFWCNWSPTLVINFFFISIQNA